MLGKKDRVNYAAIPSVIYTNPEVAAVGETEESAKAKGLDVISKTVTLKLSGRYVAENEGGNGVIKLIVGAQHKNILGVHMIGNICFRNDIRMRYGMVDQTDARRGYSEERFPAPDGRRGSSEKPHLCSEYLTLFILLCPAYYCPDGIK